MPAATRATLSDNLNSVVPFTPEAHTNVGVEPPASRPAGSDLSEMLRKFLDFNSDAHIRVWYDDCYLEGREYKAPRSFPCGCAGVRNFPFSAATFAPLRALIPS